MLEMFRNGGWGMIPTTVFGLLMVAASVRYAMKPERRLVPLQVAMAILTLSAGALGFVTGLIKTFEAIGDVAPEKRWIWMLGTGEALHNLAFALGLVTLAAIAASIGALQTARGKDAVAEAS